MCKGLKSVKSNVFTRLVFLCEIPPLCQYPSTTAQKENTIQRTIKFCPKLALTLEVTIPLKLNLKKNFGIFVFAQNEDSAFHLICI